MRKLVAFTTVLALGLATPGQGFSSEHDRPLWLTRAGSGSSSHASQVAVSPDGATVFVTGSTGTPYRADYLTFSYDAATGAILWSAGYNEETWDHANALAVSPDGSTVYVTGNTFDEDDWVAAGSATVAYSASSGAQLWVASYDGAGDHTAEAIDVSPDGSTVFVTGKDRAAGGSTTIAYSAASGAERWVTPHESIVTTALALSPDGATAFLTGFFPSSESRSSDYATMALAASTGAEVWRARYDGGSADSARAIAVSPGGSTLFVTGRSRGSGGSSDYATVAYAAASGARVWVSKYDGPDGSSDSPVGLAVSPEGSALFVTGSSSLSSDASDYATVAYSASDGGERWVSRYDGPAQSRDEARAIALSPDGSTLFVTGSSHGRPGPIGSAAPADYATIAYATTSGVERWGARFDGGCSDRAWSVAVDPHGSVAFVTGSSVDPVLDPDGEDRYDIATIAYRVDGPSITTGPPDLTVDRIHVETNEGSKGPFSAPTSIRVTVSNKGDTAWCGAARMLISSTTPTDGRTDSIGTVSVDSLAPGEQRTVELAWDGDGVLGEVRVSAEVCDAVVPTGNRSETTTYVGPSTPGIGVHLTLPSNVPDCE